MLRRLAHGRHGGGPLVPVSYDALCWGCTRDVRAEAPNTNDFAGLCGRSDNVAVHCAGCRQIIWVDHRGRRVGAQEPPGASADRLRPVAV